MKYFIRYGLESWLGDSDNEPDHVFQIEGIIMHSSGDSDEGTPCGRLRVYVLRAEDLMENGKFDRDAWSDFEELNNIATVVYAQNGDWSNDVKALWGDIDRMDVFVIEEIFLEKAHRGASLGLAIADRTISVLGRGCGLAVVSPWPSEMARRGDEDEAEVAHRKIGRYSERLGFKQIPESGLWARSLEHQMERDSN